MVERISDEVIDTFKDQGEVELVTQFSSQFRSG